MFNVCPACGMYSVEKAVVLPGPAAVCPHCGHAHPFLRMPLFLVAGASGSGKSTVALDLVPALRGEAVVLDADILWCPELATPEDEYRRWRETWLRVALNVGQSGLPVMLFGAFLPHGIEPLPERRYFSVAHYLGLVADDRELERRLRARPAWRDSTRLDFVEDMIRFNRWIKANAATTTPPIQLLDTSALDRAETVDRVVAWFRRIMAAPGGRSDPGPSMGSRL